MRLIDTHVHINFEGFQEDMEAVRERWLATGVTHLVHSCVEPSEFGRTLALARQFPELFMSVGLHPLEAHQWTEEMAREVAALAQSDGRVVAIGETGLDLYKADDLEQQVHACWGQLEIARQLNKPAIVHCRDAAEELRDVFSRFQQERGQITGVMHCWGGSPEETKWFLDMGFYISFSGIVTFKSADIVRESACLVPDERLLIETDCPFLAPVPNRGKRNEPAFVRHVAETVAQARGVSADWLADRTAENACCLFGLERTLADRDKKQSLSSLGVL